MGGARHHRGGADLPLGAPRGRVLGGRTIVGAIILGLLAGYLARALTPGPGPRGCLPTMVVGLLGAVVGYLIFTELLAIGDTEVFDLGGLPGAVIGAVIVLLGYRALAERRSAPRR